MGEANAILKALVAAVRSQRELAGQTATKTEISEELGLDARRFARVMSRKTITDEEVQQMLHRHAARNPHRPLEVVIGPTDVHVRPGLDVTHDEVNLSIGWLQVAANNVLLKIRERCDAVTRALEHGLEELGAKRIMLLRASRGSLGENETYSSIVAEVAIANFPLAGTQWSTVPLSADYCAMLETLQQHGLVELKTSKVADDALREIYQRQGITRSVVWTVTTAAGSLWYVSAVEPKDNDQTSQTVERLKEALAPHCLTLERQLDGLTK